MRRRRSAPNVYLNDSKLNGSITQPKRFYAQRDGLTFQRCEEEDKKKKSWPSLKLGLGQE